MFLFALIGCFGGDDGGDSGTTAGANSCPEYLDCAAEISPETAEDLEAAYGDGGTCWTDPEAATVCAEACDVGLVSLGAIDPFHATCGQYAPPGCYFTDGSWDLTFSPEGGDCGLSADLMQQIFSPAELWCSDTATGGFQITTNGQAQATLDCTSDVASFSCSYTGTQDELLLEGSFSDFSVASGTFSYSDDSCGTATGSFSAQD